ncbi:MAG: sulfatase-like hydrolase/transferase [Anaerolineae bacterium]|nr:sulfatase-like hydrolase/transferase [Anaerolineae bacterium]
MPQPNILIVMTDHQRADTVLPEHPAITPNVARLAEDGVTFTNTYCPSPHCCPSRATFFSGLYPSRHGVWNNICNRQALSTGLTPGVRLWSEDLAEAGYDLHFSGKWHVSVEESPKDRGWTEHFVSGAKGDYHGARWEHYRELAAQPDPTTRGEGEILRPGYGTYRLYRSANPGQHDELATQHALDLLPQLAHRSDPWGLFVGLIGPHDPYVVPQKYLDMYDLNNVPLPFSYGDELADKPRIYQRMREMRFGQLSPREVREGIRHFWAYCTYLDDLFGQILAALDATGQAENTLVLYVADHGDYCGEHGMFAKGIPCFRGAYHVPAVIRWPTGVRNPGRRVDDFVSLADFAPTFIELAGLHVDRHFAGASLLPFLQDETPAAWRDAIHTQCNGVELYYTQRSVMTRDYKYVFNGFDQDELYDLHVDPHEMRNVSDDPTYAEVKRELCGRMWRFAYEEDDTAINPYITVGLAPYGPAEAFR